MLLTKSTDYVVLITLTYKVGCPYEAFNLYIFYFASLIAFPTILSVYYIL